MAARTAAKAAVKPALKAPPKPALRPKPDEGNSSAMMNKKATQRHGFKTNEFIVYPSHGVGQIVAVEEQEVAGAKLELFVINFVKDKMTLRVPIAKVASVGMRKLAEGPLVKRALDTLKGRARIKRTMWSRRAQEYEAKINSGDIVAIAEVVRDLYRSDTQPEQSYSERQLYEAALDRLAREISAVQRITETEAIKEIEAALAKGPRRGPKGSEGEAEESDDEEPLVSEDEAA
jgi:CarD family transcriptional regulator